MVTLSPNHVLLLQQALHLGYVPDFRLWQPIITDFQTWGVLEHYPFQRQTRRVYLVKDRRRAAAILNGI